jgi:hypothetical protein
LITSVTVLVEQQGLGVSHFISSHFVSVLQTSSTRPLGCSTLEQVVSGALEKNQKGLLNPSAGRDNERKHKVDHGLFKAIYKLLVIKLVFFSLV